jgi:2-dehydropantoate 2-reductase
MSHPRLTILGSGSVGLAFAATCAKAGLGVTVLARGPALEQLRQRGVTVSGVSGDHQIAPRDLGIADAAHPAPDDIACDFLVVATKAYQVRDALGDLMGRAGAGIAPRAVLLLQNGWGSADEARAVLPPGVAIFSSIMMIGIERRAPTHVNVNVQASPIRVGTLFGSPADAMKQVVARGQDGFLPMTYEDNIEPAILNKFLFNTCLNAIGALTKMTYGELVTNVHTRQLIAQVADETIRVIQAERGLALAGSGGDYVEKILTPFVLPKAAAHRSSMLQDVEAGRRTEIDYLNGAVVRMGRHHGIPAPFNEAVAGLIRARETRAAPA